MAPPWLAARLRRATPNRVLNAVRIAGIGIVAALGQLVVDMPDGYFGAVEQSTNLGAIYAATMLVAMIGCAIAALRGSRTVRWVFAPLALVGTAFWLPAVATDPSVSGAIIVWLLATLARVAFAYTPIPRGHLRMRQPGSPYRPVAVHLLSLSLFSTALVVGFELTELFLGRVSCLVLAAVAMAAAHLVLPRTRALMRWTVASVVFVGLTLALDKDLLSFLGALGVAQIGLLAIALVEGPLVRELLRQFIERPALLVLVTFAVVAAVGAATLTIPAAAEQGRIGPLDALFTAVSATCVTGLIVVDTPSAFSPLGEAVILVLFQIGGLGIMVLSTFATLILGGRLTLRGERALEQMLDIASPQHAYRLVRFIVLATFGLEAVGAVALTFRYLAHGFDLPQAAWRGTFQAVSAFCNAGFSLQADSIVMFRSDPIALGVHAALIVLGGIGFVVLAWGWTRFVRRKRARAPVQVRVVLAASATLIVVGAVLYGALEWNRTLEGLSTGDRIANALFQSITTRTAGFNSVDFTSLRPATILLIMAFMFIGAAPGGTGGGVKVTTIAVLAAAVPEIVGARHGATLFGRTVPAETVQRAATIAVVSVGSMFVALFLLLITEDAPFYTIAFETMSAQGTVGLSLGLTGDLTAAGKWILVATMFIGRVGPLTLALAVGRRKSRSYVRYPDTRMMVG